MFSRRQVVAGKATQQDTLMLTSTDKKTTLNRTHP